MGAFFGRASELATLDAASAGAFGAGRTTAVVVEGDPGSGKTRLVAEFLSRLPAVPRISLACYQAEERLPLSLGRSLAGELRRRSDVVVDPLPVRGDLDPWPPGWSGLCEAVHRAVSLRAPLAIAVDDIQWCDDGSVGLLHYLVRGAVGQDDPLLLIAVGRPSSRLRSLTDSWRRLLADRFVHVPLGPLEHDAAVRLVRWLDPSRGDDEASALATQAGGSPFWCGFLASATDPRQSTDALVDDRLRGVSADAAAALASVVILARPVGATAIAAIHGWTEERLWRAVDELAATGLVARQGTEVGLTHDLVRAAVEGRLSGTERARELVVAWLEEEAGTDVDRLLAAAHHRSILGLSPAGPLHRVLTSPMRRMVGPDGLRTVLRLADEVPADGPGAVPVATGVAALAGELGHHRVALDRWSAVAWRLVDPTERARAWLAACDAAQHLERASAARDLLDTARRVAPADDRILAIELDAAEASLSRWLEHDPDAARALTLSALERTRSLASAAPSLAALAADVRGVYLRSLVLACVDAMQRDAADEILPLAEEIAEVAVGADTHASVQARLRSGSALMLVGRLEPAERQLASAWTDARRGYVVDLALDVGAWLTWTHYLRGDLAQADEVAAECTALADRSDDHTRPVAVVRQWARIIDVSRGDHRGAIDALRRMAAEESDAHHRIGVRQAIARSLARLDPVDAADEVLTHLHAASSDATEARCARCRTELLLSGADALARVGAEDEAERWLRSARDAGATGALEDWLVARAEASLAMTATADGGRSAEAGLERAIAGADALGMALEGIWARLDLGRWLSPRDPDRASNVLQEAAAGAQRAGAHTEARLAAKLLRGTGRRTWHRPVPHDDDHAIGTLTPREREITVLVADGASNLDIAQTLFLSRKTIERHVSNIFVKLAVRNRTQLAARVAAGQVRAEVPTPDATAG